MSENNEQLPVSSEEESKEQVESQTTAKHNLTVPPDESRDSIPTPQVSPKTQGVKPTRDNGIGILQSAAKKAAASNSRSDVHEYMRIRRSFI